MHIVEVVFCVFITIWLFALHIHSCTATFTCTKQTMEALEKKVKYDDS